MSAHTKEPWPLYSEVAQQMHPVLDHTCAWLDFDDYDRARVCVNACAGVPNEFLGKIANKETTGSEFFELGKVTAQRDELLEALQHLVCIIDKAGLINLAHGVQLGATSWLVKATDSMEYAKSAIAKCESK